MFITSAPFLKDRTQTNLKFIAPGIAVVAALVLAIIASPAAAIIEIEKEDFVHVIVDGVATSIDLEIIDGKGTAIADNVFLSLPGEYEITISAMLDPDPQIGYAAAVTDFGAPSTFGFAFSQFIVPTAAPGVASHSHSSSTTDAGGGDGTPVTAMPPPVPVDGDATPEIAVFNVSTNGGGSFLNAGLDLSPSFVGASPSDTQGPFNPASIAGPGAGTYDAMRVDVNFSMAGNGDAYTFNGLAEIIPEPATLVLIGLGLAGVVRTRRSIH